MRIVIALLLTTIAAFAQGGGYCTMSTWEPRNVATKTGLLGSYDPGNQGSLTGVPSLAGGNKVSDMSNRVYGVTGAAGSLVQATSGNQPTLSRTDNAGNLIGDTENFSNWSATGVNSFGSTDTGAAGAGSFSNTSRTTDPLGGNTAEFVQEGTGGTVHEVDHGVKVVSGTVITLGVFAKADAQTKIMLYDLSASKGKGFKLDDGTAFTVTGITVPTSYAITSIGSGWYLCQITLAANGNDTFSIYGVTNTTYSYLGNNTKGVFLWGASVVPSSWTQVTGTSVSLGYVANTSSIAIVPGLSGRSVLYFDGAARRMATAAFTLNQPTEVYGLFNHWTWTLNDAVFDGGSLATGKFYESATTPKLRGNAGTDMTEVTPTALGTWQVDTVTFDSTRSRIQINGGDPSVSDAGAGNMGGFSLGSAATAGTTYWNGLAARLLICNKTNAIGEGDYLRWGMLKQAGLYYGKFTQTNTFSRSAVNAFDTNALAGMNIPISYIGLAANAANVSNVVLYSGATALSTLTPGSTYTASDSSLGLSLTNYNAKFAFPGDMLTVTTMTSRAYTTLTTTTNNSGRDMSGVLSAWNSGSLTVGLNAAGSGSDIEYCNIGNACHSLRAGWLKKVTINMASPPATIKVYVKTWEMHIVNGVTNGTWDCTGATPDLYSSLTPNHQTTVTLDTPLPISEHGAVSLMLRYNGSDWGYFAYAASAPSSYHMMSYLGEATNNFNWPAKTDSASTLLGLAPLSCSTDMAFMSDSRESEGSTGAGAWSGPMDVDQNNPGNRSLTTSYWLAKISGLRTQNHGKSGTVMSSLLSSLDALNANAPPTVAIIQLGANDWINGVSVADYTTSASGILTKLKGYGTKAVFVEDWGWSPNTTNNMLATFLGYNAAISNLCAANPTDALFVRACQTMCTNGEPCGLLSAYDGGFGCHPNVAGHTMLAQVTWTAIQNWLLSLGYFF